MSQTPSVGWQYSTLEKIVDKRYDGSNWEYKIKYTKYEVVQISYYVKEMFATKKQSRSIQQPHYI